uniref:Uncharacterized protein n=1 Tax=Solanum tuberosum TaxID=4113 RepID=M1DV36_SOLTU
MSLGASRGPRPVTWKPPLKLTLTPLPSTRPVVAFTSHQVTRGRVSIWANPRELTASPSRPSPRPMVPVTKPHHGRGSYEGKRARQGHYWVKQRGKAEDKKGCRFPRPLSNSLSGTSTRRTLQCIIPRKKPNHRWKWHLDELPNGSATKILIA